MSAGTTSPLKGGLFLLLVGSCAICSVCEPGKKPSGGETSAQALPEKIEPSPLPAERFELARVLAQPRAAVRKFLGKPSSVEKSGEHGTFYDRDNFVRGQATVMVAYDSKGRAAMVTVEAPRAGKNLPQVREWLGLAREGKPYAGTRPVSVGGPLDNLATVDDDGDLGRHFNEEVDLTAGITLRKDWARRIETEMLNSGFDVTVRATGQKAQTLSVSWVLCNRAVVTQISNGLGMPGKFINGPQLHESLHFNEIRCTDPFTGDGGSVRW